MSQSPSTRPLEGDTLRIEQLKEKLAQVQGQNFFTSRAINTSARRDNSLVSPGSRPAPTITLPDYRHASPVGPSSPGVDGQDSVRSIISRRGSIESIALSTRSNAQRRVAPVILPAPGKNALIDQRKDSHHFRLMPSHTNLQSSHKTTNMETAAPSSEVVPFLYQDLDDVKRTGKASLGVLPSPSFELSNPFDSSSDGKTSTGHSTFSPLNPQKQSTPQSAPSTSKPRTRTARSECPSNSHNSKIGRGFFNNLIHKKKKEGPHPKSIAYEGDMPQTQSPFTSPFETTDTSCARSQTATPSLASFRLPVARRQTLQADNVLRTKNSVVSEKSPGTSISTNGVVLDTDMSHMSGIIKTSTSVLVPKNDFSFDNTRDNALALGSNEDFGEAAWAPPESWAVRKPEDIARDDADFDGPDPLENPLAIKPNATQLTFASKGAESSVKRGPNHQMRIFRGDWTFATVACGLQTTVESLMVILGRKFFLSSVSNHQILLERNGLSRILQSWEKPFLLQLRLLEDAGYTDRDRLEEIGREDNSYLCRFIFTTCSMPSFSLVRFKSHCKIEINHETGCRCWWRYARTLRSFRSQCTNYPNRTL